MTMQEKPFASLSLDLDNKWSYLKTHGDSGWQELPTFLPFVVRRILDDLTALKLRITFFVVGMDADQSINFDALQAIAAARHEIANHSYHHEPWLQQYSDEQLSEELDQAEHALRRITDLPPQGFRGPGYSHSPALLRQLVERGYRYDASTLPTFLGPVARAYYFTTARLTPAERLRRAALFGTFRDGFRPLQAYTQRTPSGPLVEIPVTTFPVLRTPFHVSYLLYLAERSPSLAIGYFRMALAACRLWRVEPSLLLHPLDFLGGDDEREMSFFPGMRWSGQRKREFVRQVLDLYARQFNVGTMTDHALRVASPVPLLDGCCEDHGMA